MGVTSNYFAIQDFYEKKYGITTVVLMQIGSFYEIYEYDPEQSDQPIENFSETDNFHLKLSLQAKKYSAAPDPQIEVPEAVNPDRALGHAVNISMLLHMKLTSKNKGKPHSRDNPFLVGFPCVSYDKYRDAIIMGGYTIVRVDQKGNGDNDREIVEISSLGTEIDMLDYMNTGHIVSVFLEMQKISVSKNPDRNKIVCGLSFIDISTGKTSLHEVYSKDSDESYPILEIYRFLAATKPNNLLINISTQGADASNFLTYLTETLELEKYSQKSIRIDELDQSIFKAEYQDDFLAKIYGEGLSRTQFIKQPGTGTISTIESLDLELLHYARISYIILLQYCYEHNEKLIVKIQKPEIGWTDQSRHLILTHNALHQLDILPIREKRIKRGKTYDSLLSVVDNTKTNLGHRFLMKQLVTPITDINQLELYYSLTQELMINEQLLGALEKNIKMIPDIEKLQRKLQMSMIGPSEFYTLFKGYLKIMDLYTTLYNYVNQNEGSYLRTILLTDRQIAEFNQCLAEIVSQVDFEELNQVEYIHRVGNKTRKFRVTTSFIRPGFDQDIDVLTQHLTTYHERLQAICDNLNTILEGKRGKKISPNIDRPQGKKLKGKKVPVDEDTGVEIKVTLSTTNYKAQILRSNSNKINGDLCGTLSFQSGKSESLIFSEPINKYCQEIETLQIILEHKLLAKYDEILATMANKEFFLPLNSLIAKLDFLISNARTAKKYKYTRPQIDKTAPKSYIQITDLRHPLIERLSKNEYITNDITVGSPGGLLLFGVNSTGKTSLAKSVGVSIIMAQAGMFVPGNILYRPYTKIITRLSGTDDLLGGKSSFIVEMFELRTILRNSDCHTLVLGDELCRGTETQSGTALTVATLEELVRRQTSFIFSTHMHQLPEVGIIKELRQSGHLQISHLSAIYDPVIEKLVYDRKLTEGSGSSLYGLEVCKSLAMDPTFISRANELRKTIFGITDQYHNNKTSKYNGKIYVDNCAICNTRIELQTHHINEQTKADEEGFIGHYHKNSSFNLVIICKKCHDNLHLNKKKLVPKQTLTGIYLSTINEGTDSKIIDEE